jgi:hypothetical protein
VKKYCITVQATNDNMAHAECMVDTCGYKHTLTICNTCCFVTATTVGRTRLNVTLYVHYLSCFEVTLTACFPAALYQQIAAAAKYCARRFHFRLQWPEMLLCLLALQQIYVTEVSVYEVANLQSRILEDLCFHCPLIPMLSVTIHC